MGPFSTALNAKARAAGKSTRYALNSSYADMTQAEFAAAILRAGVGLRKFFNNSEEHKDFYSYGQRGHATHAESLARPRRQASERRRPPAQMSPFSTRYLKPA